MTASGNQKTVPQPASAFGDRALTMGAKSAQAELASGMARSGGQHQILMGLAGFIGGLIVVVPVVLWLAAETRLQRLEGKTASASRAASASVGSPALVSAPTRAERIVRPATAPEPDDKNITRPEIEAVAIARQLISSGDIAGARHLLSAPDLAQDGEAVFMLAETYDPNVLAALAATGVMAEAPTARRLYETARGLGMLAAERRLEQLR